MVVRHDLGNMCSDGVCAQACVSDVVRTNQEFVGRERRVLYAVSCRQYPLLVYQRAGTYVLEVQVYGYLFVARLVR